MGWITEFRTKVFELRFSTLSMIIKTKTNRTLQKNMLLSSLVLFIAVGKSLCSVDQDCDAIFYCESCTSQDSWSGDTCRWCPLTRECHAYGSPVNHCIWNQNIRMTWQCESKSYGHYNPKMAYEQALFSTAAYSTDPQSCLDQIMPDGGFEVARIINGSCDHLFEYEDCFAYTAVSVDKKTILVAFRGTEEMTQLTEQALMMLFKQKTRFKTGGGGGWGEYRNISLTPSINSIPVFMAVWAISLNDIRILLFG